MIRTSKRVRSSFFFLRSEWWGGYHGRVGAGCTVVAVLVCRVRGLANVVGWKHPKEAP